METQQDLGNNVKLGIGFDCCDVMHWTVIDIRA